MAAGDDSGVTDQALMLAVCSPLPPAGEGLGERAGACKCDGFYFVETPALSPAPLP
ncbi:hypothetical protein CT19431_MP60069 [Cupriavidus taiwanensis]|nr:hypothetical protein CT19431_MP60069 [Cupriavidus taiwanensis]